MARLNEKDRRRLYRLGAFIVVVAVVGASIPALNRPSGPVFDLVIGLLLAVFGLVMTANPGDVRGRWNRSMYKLSTRVFPEAMVRNQRMPSPSAQRWYGVALFALGCLMTISALGGVFH